MTRARHVGLVAALTAVVLAVGVGETLHREDSRVIAPARPAPATAPARPLVADGHGWHGTTLDGPDQADGSCHYRPTPAGVLPDPACTPGSVDPAVTQDNLDATICSSGYTDTVRPPSSTTARYRLLSARAYGVTTVKRTDEYDHLVPLSVGGSSDRRNLWLEVEPVLPNPKDRVEAGLLKLVCSRRMPLVEAQRRIALDWTTALPA